MVGLEVRLEDMADRPPSRFSEPQVVVQMVEVGIAHGELALPLSAKEIGRATGRGMEDLAKDHASLLIEPLRLIHCD